jgi:hypothetical protein
VEKTGLAAVNRALGELTRALARLGTRKGERAGVARAYLQGEIDRLRASVSAFLALGADPESAAPAYDGPSIITLEATFAGFTAAANVARSQIAHAETAEQLAAGRAALDAANFASKQAYRALDALADSVAFPSLPDVDALGRAMSDTDHLASVARGKTPYRTLQLAIEQVDRADQLTALLYVVFEPEKDPGGIFAKRAEICAEFTGVSRLPAAPPRKRESTGFRSDVAELTGVEPTGDIAKDFRDTWAAIDGDGVLRRELYQLLGARWPGHFSPEHALDIFSRAWAADHEAAA